MIRVKTFATPLRIFEAARELEGLDAQVAAFLAEQKASAVYSVSDATTAGDGGETIGLVRVVAYEA